MKNNKHKLTSASAQAPEPLPQGDPVVSNGASTEMVIGEPAAPEANAGLGDALALGAQPSHVNDFGCEVFRDEAAKQKLVEWGYPWMGGSRYPFDEHLKGWEQFDTPQDASYYGVWTSVDRRAVVSYAEGDVCLVVAPGPEEFQNEVRSLWDWNYNYDPGSGVHTQMDSPKLHAAALVGHPPFDKTLADYAELKELRLRYEALHTRAYEKLHDPALPKGQFHVLSTDEHVYFLRGWDTAPRDICVCRKFGYDLNAPDKVLSPYWGKDAATVAMGIELLKEFVGE